MTFEDYLKSETFLRFQDETLRSNAAMAVEKYLSANDDSPVDRRQLHAIPAAIMAGGSGELRRLTDKQKEKNSNQHIKAFWSFLSDQVFNVSGPEDGLQATLRKALSDMGFIQDETASDDRKEKNRIKKDNRTRIDMAMEAALPVYFKHFTCHYFFQRMLKSKP